MLYEFYQESPKEMMKILAENMRRRRLEKGYSRRFLSEYSGVPVPTIAKFERDYSISLLSYVKLAQTLGYNDQLKALMGDPRYSTIEELDEINNNKNRKRGYRNENS